MSTALESKENEFARKVVRALDETTSGIPAAAVDRLAAARRAAIARKKPEKVAVTAPAFTPAFAGAAGGQFGSPPMPAAARPVCALRTLRPCVAAARTGHRTGRHRLLGRPAAHGGTRRHRRRHAERQPAARRLSRSRLQRVPDAQSLRQQEFPGELQARSRDCFWMRDCGNGRVRRDVSALLFADATPATASAAAPARRERQFGRRPAAASALSSSRVRSRGIV